MLFRFSLYGFLKSQRYFEPFMILAFREKGLSFFQIGLLIGFREICINVMEVPTGAVADIVGRRKAMILSHIAYAASFVVFGLVSTVPLLVAAMFLFSLGEAFRTGTHKAIIFSWLQHEGRGDDRTVTYGYTRSWSQIGSAVSVLIAAGIVMALRSYTAIFWISAIPACMNIVNFMSYPKYLDGGEDMRRTPIEIWRTLLDGLRQVLRQRALRHLLLQSMRFEGVAKVSEDYLQPILRQVAIALPIFAALAPEKRTALVVGIVYAALYVLTSVASRKADAVRRFAGGEEKGLRLLWVGVGVTFIFLLVGTTTHVTSLAVAGFVVLAVIQNLWRPIMVGAIASQTVEKTMATVLSVESQAASAFTAILAPALGFAVDAMPAQWRFAPVAVLGLVVVGAGLLGRGRKGPPRS